ncbi:MAG: hypothetical protein FGM46_07375 [Ferruginibacter sp.]|nr:hypothetical protein [Ferruginibacter sp.]
MSPYFKETSFYDLTLNKITMTYAPFDNLPESISLRQWILYINPETNLIDKAYIEKQITPQKKIQLTWNKGKNCRQVYLTDDENGKSRIEKTIEIKWEVK